MKTPTPQVHGVVLAGGRSTRMGRDKALLRYHARPQVVEAYELVRALCPDARVSCRSEPGDSALPPGLPLLPDAEPYRDGGPMAGILTALSADPDAAWLVVACDLPFLRRATLDRLLHQRDPMQLATAYRSAHDGLPEPLCAVYEPQFKVRLDQFFAEGMRCPRKALIRSSVKLIALEEPDALDNINRPDEYEQARQRLET